MLRPGRYDLSFRVKTGVRGAEFSAGKGYEYRIDGVKKAFIQSGPTAVDGEWLVWGYHKMFDVSLPKGFVTIQVSCASDWALLDSLTLKYVMP